MNWNFLFSRNNVHEQVIVNQTLMNIFANYIPNKLITIDDNDPPWMKEYIMRKKMDKKVVCLLILIKNYDACLKLQTISTKLSKTILKRKEDDYYCQLSDKLNDPKTIAKAYWPILKTPYNGKKIPLISLILVKNKLILNFKEEANHFNTFFASPCTLVCNNSDLPNTTNSVSNVILSHIQFKDQDILKIIYSLNYTKAHGGDNISIRLLKISDSSTVKPLSIIFKNSLQTGTFHNNWKKSVLPTQNCSANLHFPG